MRVLEEKAIYDNYCRVLDQIQQAARQAGREPGAVKLVVVTKGHSLQAVRAALAAGARYLGENYVDEGIEKIKAGSRQGGVEWHMIGHIQSRKARPVCEHFDQVHSLDSLKLARRLDQFAGELNRKLPVMLECNVSGEASKFGLPAWQTSLWPGLLEIIGPILDLANLQVRGLMTMAPFFDQPELARPYFQRLRGLLQYLTAQLPAGNWVELSMGMSGDFEVAVQEGATLVRIGTAILGPRSSQ